MFAPPPPAAVAPAPSEAPATLEAAFLLARAVTAPARAPLGVLLGDGTVEDKLAAIDAIHSRIPDQKKPQKISSLDALASAAAPGSQPVAVRMKALTYLGYAMPQVPDDAARGRALKVLIPALQEPLFRLAALRGFGPAGHDLPKSLEAPYLNALLGLLDGPVAGEEREAALTALAAFVTNHEDLSKRAPDLVAAIDDRVLAPVEKNPAAFVADPRGTPGSRALTASLLWMSARHRETLGDPAPAARAHALLVALDAVETDPTAKSWIESYRDAAPPRPAGLIARTTRRRPAGEP